MLEETKRHTGTWRLSLGEGLTRHELVHPIPLLARKLPAAVHIPRFLEPDHCRRLIVLAEQKGLDPIEKSRHDQATFSAKGAWLLPKDDDLIFQRFADQAATSNAENWRLPLAGIYSPFSVLRYGPGDWIRPHVDVDYRLADATKLTCVVQLVPKDDFEGGVLTIAENEAYDLDIGDAVFFPAGTLHSVSPITSGVRTVLAAWAQGPDVG
jgi:predicted 2-oxoglutarate/Fe(II)-dependent dioxygenase YbiX